MKGYTFLSFRKNIGSHATILAKKWAISIVRNFLIVLKKSATNAIKTASKRAIQKTPEPTGDLIGNKNADRMRNL